MSADNYLAIRHDGVDWAVKEGNASTSGEYIRSHHKSRDQAVDAAQDILRKEIVEYGISVIEKKATGLDDLKQQLTRLTGSKLNDEELDDLVRFVKIIVEKGIV